MHRKHPRPNGRGCCFVYERICAGTNFRLLKIPPAAAPLSPLYKGGRGCVTNKAPFTRVPKSMYPMICLPCKGRWQRRKALTEGLLGKSGPQCYSIVATDFTYSPRSAVCRLSKRQYLLAECQAVWHGSHRPPKQCGG